MARVEHAPAAVEHGERLERLYREQGARMWHAVLAFAGDPEVPCDAVAEAFAQALRRGDEIRDAERWMCIRCSIAILATPTFTSLVRTARTFVRSRAAPNGTTHRSGRRTAR